MVTEWMIKYIERLVKENHGVKLVYNEDLISDCSKNLAAKEHEQNIHTKTNKQKHFTRNNHKIIIINLVHALHELDVAQTRQMFGVGFGLHCTANQFIWNHLWI